MIHARLAGLCIPHEKSKGWQFLLRPCMVRQDRPRLGIDIRVKEVQKQERQERQER